MPQVNASDFRKGVKVVLDGEPYEMLECNFVKPGKGQALYKTKLRNLLKGTILDRTYKSGDGLEEADVHKSEGQYLYRDPDNFYFMDNDSFEQYTLPASTCGDAANFLLENAVCGLLFWNGRLIEMTPPAQVVVEVTYTEPAARGNTANSVSKPATVETGATVAVPAFINTGDRIKVDARTGEYIERSNK
ncbi:MAG: elongation factor P [Planctomycetaceae bacterium]